MKAELVTAAGSLMELADYVEAGADAVQVGDDRYGMRLPGNMGPEDWKEAAALAHSRGAKLYVVANRILENDMLPGLPTYLRKAAEAGADAVVFGDPAVLAAAREADLSGLAFHWNPEMTATNYVTANYWGSKGATRAILARELNLEQVLEFKRHSRVEVQVQVHGATNIFHSKRRMVTNYLEHQGKQVSPEEDCSQERKLYLVEEERQDERYPVYEDAGGTHIMSGDDLCMLENLHELLEGGLDSLKVESLLKSREYNITVLRSYRKAIDAYAADPDRYEFRQEWLDAIEAVQPEGRPLSFGFYYKEQVY
ncbi:peptidase U32 family protein [Gorillibacterium sp. sgz5001074]|uniref:peptidase U32 family protein n=1 Tax=Gorillibacterium sp. sgz5001074 TaxID=3446695 RepID=UPI003F67BD5A